MFDRPVIDSVTFAREAGELRGKSAVAALPRLHDALFDDSGEIGYGLAGFVNEQGRPSLRLALSGQLKLSCQRCLGPMDFRLDSTREFELVPQGQPLGDLTEEADGVDQIHADPKLDVLMLVEDETILSLPMVAGHADGACKALSVSEAGEETKSPFSALAALKRQ